MAERARIGVIGPNGGGKSTLMRILAGIEPDDAGIAPPARAAAAYMPQQVAPDPRTPRQSFVPPGPRSSASRATWRSAGPALPRCSATST